MKVRIHHHGGVGIQEVAVAVAVAAATNRLPHSSRQRTRAARQRRCGGTFTASGRQEGRRHGFGFGRRHSGVTQRLFATRAAAVVLVTAVVVVWSSRRKGHGHVATALGTGGRRGKSAQILGGLIRCHTTLTRFWSSHGRHLNGGAVRVGRV